VRVGGWDTAREGREARRRVGFCFTNPDSQIVMPTVAKDVAVGLRRRGLTKAETATRVDAVLRTYGLDAHADHAAHRLSGGQKQLLALASVLATEQELLVMDDRVLELINDHVTRYPPRAVTLALGEERRSGADFNSTIWHPALVAVGIEPKRETGCHALRHFYASTLLDAGESILALSEYFGHATQASPSGPTHI
jgi:hypothetical protein